MIDDRIKTENSRSEKRELIEPFLLKLKEKKEILAILLLGGLSNNNIRNHMDEFSDIDISIFFKSKEALPKYVPNFEFYIFDCLGKEIEVNVHQMVVDTERQIAWDEGKKEAYMHAEYYFERNQEARKLIETKIAFDEAYRINRLALILSQYKWYVEINPIRAIKRGFLINAIELLNNGVELFFEALYLLNREYQPHLKWRFEASCDLKWIPQNYRSKMEKVLLSTEITEEAILNKRENIIILFQEVIEKIVETLDFDSDYYRYACINSYTDRQIVNETYADNLVKRTKNFLDEREKKLLYSLANRELVESDSEFLNLHIEKYSEEFKCMYNKVKENI